MKSAVSILVLIWLLIPSLSYACRQFDDYVVFAQDLGSEDFCYAISLPPDALKNATGKTTVHSFRNGKDDVVFSLDWYSRNLYLKCGELKAGRKGISLVRALYQHKEPYKALKDQDYNVLEFYVDGKHVKSHTARELVSGEKSYWPTLCGDKILWKTSLDYSEDRQSSILRVQFALKSADFDLATGEIIKIENKPDKVWAEIIGLPLHKEQPLNEGTGITAPERP